MRNSILGLAALAGGLCALPAAAFADNYICALGEVFECEPVRGCNEVSASAVNLPEFIVLDTEKKTLSGATLNKPSRTEDIEGMRVTDKHIFIHGQQDEETWNATISRENGALTGGVASQPSSFAVFGHCTKK